MQLSGKSLLIESVPISDLPLRGTTAEFVTPLFVRLKHDVPLEFSPRLNQPLLQLDHNPHSGYTIMHHAQDTIIHNLGQDCRMATC